MNLKTIPARINQDFKLNDSAGPELRRYITRMNEKHPIGNFLE